MSLVSLELINRISGLCGDGVSPHMELMLYIVGQSVISYTTALKTLEYNPNNSKALAVVEEEECFYRSKLFDIAFNIDCEEWISLLRTGEF